MNPEPLARLYLDGQAVDPTANELAILRQWIDDEFRAIPCPVEFHYQDIDLPTAERIYQSSGILAISVMDNSHPYLTFQDNAQFRAVHDWHHISMGIDSTLQGEIAAFNHARFSAPLAIHWLLFSEIVLQAAAMLHTGQFQPQKFVNAYA